MPIGSCDSWSAFFLALLRMVKGGVLLLKYYNSE